MTLNVPVGVDVTSVVFLITTNFNLLETPLGKDRIGCTEVAPKNLMAEPKSGGQGMDRIDLVLASTLDVVDDFHNPVVVVITDGQVSVTRHLVV